MPGKDTKERGVEGMPKKGKKGFRPTVRNYGTALAVTLGSLTLSSCSEVTPETVQELWEKTEALWGKYNSTYDSVESLKAELRGVETKLTSPNLNKAEKKYLTKQKNGLIKTIKILEKDKDEYLLDWNDAVEEYEKSKAELAGDSSQNLNYDSRPNGVDWHLPSIPSPD